MTSIFYAKFKTPILRIFLVLILFNLGACSQAGWIGYYSIKKPDGSENKIEYNTDNGVVLDFPKKNEFWLTLPRGCSEFFTIGIITTFTPPFPIAWFRSWHRGDNPCHFFTAETKPNATLHLKIIDSKTKQEIIFEAKTEEGKWGYTKYIFPILAKNIDSGIIIIEKNQEKIEVPFKYKYFKFLY